MAQFHNECDVVVYDTDDHSGTGILVPRCVTINGRVVHLPSDATMALTCGPEHPVTLTLTIFPSRLEFRAGKPEE